MPSVTFRALDDQGKETLDVKVLIDGVQVATAIEARASSCGSRRAHHSLRARRRSLGRGQGDASGPARRTGSSSSRSNRDGGRPRRAPAWSSVVPPSGDGEANGFHVPLLGWVGLGVTVAGGIMTAAFAVSANNGRDALPRLVRAELRSVGEERRRHEGGARERRSRHRHRRPRPRGGVGPSSRTPASTRRRIRASRSTSRRAASSCAARSERVRRGSVAD